MCYVSTGETYLQDRSTNFPTLYYCQDPNKCWLKCSQVALILPLLLWAGNPETKTVTACVEHYAALELLYLNPKQASFNIVHQNLLRQSFNSGPIRVHLFP